MRFHIGKPPATPDFTPEEDGWTPLKEPTPLVLNLLATPVGILAAALIAMGWGSSSVSFEFSSSEYGPLAPLVFLVAVVGIGLPALIAIHELIHALGYPKFGLTPSTTIAIWPSKLLILAMTTDALRRDRLLLVYMLPLLVISVLPPDRVPQLGLRVGQADARIHGQRVSCWRRHFLFLSDLAPSSA